MRASQVGLFGLVLTLCAPMAACKGKSQIAGVVVDWSTGEGISGATVKIYQQEERGEITTDDMGGFAYTIKGDPEAALIVAAEGYKTQDVLVGEQLEVYQQPGFNQEQPSENGVSVTRVRLIPKNQTVGGSTTVNGEPFDGVTISVWCGASNIGTTTPTGGAWLLENLELCVSNSNTQNFVVQNYVVSAEFDYDGDGIVDYTGSQTVNSGQGGMTSVDWDRTFEPPDEELILDAATIEGYVFVNDQFPADGATVLLEYNNDTARGWEETTTAADGSFSYTVDAKVGWTYDIEVLPFDIDGDGWVDTGVDDDFVQYPWTTGDNIWLELGPSAGSYGIQNSNVCFGGVDFLRPDENPYVLFANSLDLNLLDWHVRDPHNEVMEGWSANTIGNFFVEIVPPAPLTPTSDPSDVYTWQIDSLVFQDGFVSADPASSGSAVLCQFDVSTPPTVLDAPQPSLYVDTVGGVASVAANADQIDNFDVNGLWSFQDNLQFVDLTWPHVPGADFYRVFARQSNGDVGNGFPTDTQWYEVATVDGDSIVNQTIFATINIDDRNIFNGIAEPYFNGGLGPVFGMGNEITIVAMPVDEDGHWNYPSPSDASLVLSDTVAPRLDFATLGNWSVVPGTSTLQHDILELYFNENMDVNQVVDGSEISTFGGRWSNLTLNGAAYWGFNQTPQTVANTVTYNDLTVEVQHGSTITMSNANDDRVFDSTEIGAFTGYAIGQTVGFVDVNADAVYYGEITGINTSAPALTTTSPGGYVEESGDIIFDPCASYDSITAEAAEFTRDLTVNDASQFYEGQTVQIGPEFNPFSAQIESISGNTLTLFTDIVSSQEVGSVVWDANCFFGPGDGSFDLRDDISVLNTANDVLITTTEISSTTNSLEFNGFAVDLDGVVAGDKIWFFTFNDEVAWANITNIRTINNDGTGREDTDGNPIWEVTFDSVTPVRGTTLPFLVDPSTDQVLVSGDGILVSTTAPFSDTSGNSGISASEANLVLLDNGGFSDVIYTE